MGKIPGRSTITNPQIFQQTSILANIATLQQFAWNDQPFWPKEGIQFNPNDKSHRRKLITALADKRCSPALNQLAYELYMCSSDTQCGSPLCNYCRTRLQDRIEKRVLSYFGESKRSELRFLTVLHDVTYSPVTDAPKLQKYLKRKMKRVFENAPTLKNMKVFGGFELDAKKPSTMENKEEAVSLLRQYGMVSSSAVAYMPHFHAIVDLNSTDVQVLKSALRAVFSKPKQISVGSLYKDKTKEYHLGKLARYMFKFRYHFADNILREKPSYGTIFDDQTMYDFSDALLVMTKGKRGARSFEFKYNL